MKIFYKISSIRQIIHDIASWLTIIPLLISFTNSHVFESEKRELKDATSTSTIVNIKH